MGLAKAISRVDLIHLPDHNAGSTPRCRKKSSSKAHCQGLLAENPFTALGSQPDAGSLSRHTTAELEGRDNLLLEATVSLYSIPFPATAIA